MNSDLIKSTIEFDSHQFWVNSVNSLNCDALFIQHGVTDANKAKKIQNNDKETNNLIRGFFELNYLLKGEYFIAYMNNMLLTNRRLFIWYGDVKKSIALKNFIKYKVENNALQIQYLNEGILQNLNIGTTWLNENNVNNAFNNHSKDITSESEAVLASNFKAVIQAKYQIYEDTYTSVQSPKNYRGLIALCMIVIFFGGCFYMIKSNSSDSSSVSNYSSKKKIKCTWCGGIGRVGYAGESEKQYNRKGMGLGNSCIRCNGTGRMDEDHDK